jgi:phosphoglycerate dehydrogenase-like enzyme
MVWKQSSEVMSQQQLVLLPPQENFLLKDGKVTGPFSEEIVSILPPTLKWLCHSGAGYDNIDVEACTQRDSSSHPQLTLPQTNFRMLSTWSDYQESKCLILPTVTKAQSLI